MYVCNVNVTKTGIHGSLCPLFLFLRSCFPRACPCGMGHEKGQKSVADALLFKYNVTPVNLLNDCENVLAH